MFRGVQALLTQVVDYTGLAAPTNSTPAEAIGDYARFRAEPDAWMLARLLCPAAQLDELGEHGQSRFTRTARCRLSVLGAENPLAASAVKDPRAMSRFLNTHSDWAAIEALEVRLSPEASSAWRPEAISEGLNVLAGRLIEHKFAYVEVFLEPTITDKWDACVRRVIAALRIHDERRGQPAPARVGLTLPLRAADSEPAATVGEVALAIAACRDARVPMKFSGEPHGPLACVGSGGAEDLPGFLNLLIAGVLAYARGVEESVLREVLAERDPRAFSFGDDGFRWRGLSADIGDIVTARDELVLSFGSGRFDQVREGLNGLGLL
jgi:hypothetical protein